MTDEQYKKLFDAWALHSDRLETMKGQIASIMVRINEIEDKQYRGQGIKPMPFNVIDFDRDFTKKTTDKMGIYELPTKEQLEEISKKMDPWRLEMKEAAGRPSQWLYERDEAEILEQLSKCDIEGLRRLHRVSQLILDEHDSDNRPGDPADDDDPTGDTDGSAIIPTSRTPL
jgi:hypothetical protein